jgi:hypothetical protein
LFKDSPVNGTSSTIFRMGRDRADTRTNLFCRFVHRSTQGNAGVGALSMETRLSGSAAPVL